MEVASRYTLFTSLTLFVNTGDMVDTVDMVYTVDMICTADMVYTADTAALFGTLIMKSLCRGWMDGTDGSYPRDCYDCHEYSSCSK